MTTLMIPKDTIVYPTLGPQICAWMEEYLVHGPGDLRGQPYHLDTEKRALLYKLYEVFPKDHPLAGRRRFRRGAISEPKGTAKTEFGACIAAAELHPDAPVRCDGFDAKGQPVGIGVIDPYIPMVAYTEEQSDELAYYALKTILEYSVLVDDFDIGIQRIMRINGDGKAVSLASSPDSRDGARTTFQLCDETHRWNTPRLIKAHRTMLANLPKRLVADPWSLEITTAPSPGEGSVAENTMEYARQVNEGTIKDSQLFFFHRQASETHDLNTADGLRAAVIEARGPAAAWADIDGICAQFQDPTANKPYLCRVWLNQLVKGGDRAFDVEKWKSLNITKKNKKKFTPKKGNTITLGFDGARWEDSVALIGTELETNCQWPLGIWEKPTDRQEDEWEAPEDEINSAVDYAFSQFNVWRMYCDPPYWESQVAAWSGKYGDKRVIAWWTNRLKQTAYAIKAFNTAINAGEVFNNGDDLLTRHIGNAVRRDLRITDDKGEPLCVIYKERKDSPFKIDGAMAAILSWQARCDAIAAGVAANNDSVYSKRGLISL